MKLSVNALIEHLSESSTALQNNWKRLEIYRKLFRVHIYMVRFMNNDTTVILIVDYCKSAFFHLRNIGSIRNMLTGDACSQLIHSLVTVRIDYCYSLFYGMPDSTLFRLQNILTLLLVFLRKFLSFLTLLISLRTCIGFQLDNVYTFNILLLTYQAYQNTAPDYICELIRLTPYCNARIILGPMI